MELTNTKYKETEIGFVPNDWELKKLGDIANFYKGKGLPKADIVEEGENKCIHYGELFTKYNQIITSIASRTNKKDEFFLSKENDVLMPTSDVTPNGLATASALFEDDIILGGDILIIRPIKNLYAAFLSYQISMHRQQIMSLVSGTTVYHLYGSDMAKFKFAVPDFNEQKRIIKALSDVDDLISNLDKLISKKKAIKQGAMQQLLTPPHKGGKRLAGFTGEWVEKKLGDVAQMNSGGTPSSKVSEYYNGNINWVSITDMTNSGKFIYSTEKKITEKGLQNSSARLFSVDTVLLAMYASIGKCTIAKTELATSQAILGITVNTSLGIEFLYYYLKFKKDELISQGQQGTQSNLNKGMVQDITMCLPQLKEQIAIAQILSDMDYEIEQLETKKAKYLDIKQGMMQELLTGKTRLV